MKKEYLLKGLDCPNCAAKIEQEIREIEYVSKTEISLITQALKIEFDDDYSDVIDRLVKEAVHRHEPDIIVLQYDSDEEDNDDGDDDLKKEIISIIIGAVLFFAAVIISLMTSLPLPVYLLLLVIAYLILGGEVIIKSAKNIIKGNIFDENFLMSISTIGAFVIGEYHEAVAVMLFYRIGELLQDIAVDRSRRSIAKLMDIRPDRAAVIRNGIQTYVPPETVTIGETIVVRPGERIPLDGIVTDGETYLDTAPLTGEAEPKGIKAGDEVISGCINLSGMISMRVTKAFKESTVSRILKLVEDASTKKASTESFITEFAKYYTPVVVAAAVFLSVIPPLLFSGSWAEWIHRGLIFLVISCPCALVLSIPLAFFAGIGASSKHGILVKGGNCIEAMNKVETVVFDKTGTITKGVFNVSEMIPADGVSQESLVECASAAESFSNHPIAKSIVRYCAKKTDNRLVSEYTEKPGLGTRVIFKGKEILAGSFRLMEENGIEYTSFDKPGTIIYVACEGKYLGCLVITDEIKQDSRQAIEDLRELGIRKTVMLTGDGDSVAADICKKAGIDEYRAQLMPDDKVRIMDEIRSENSKGKKTAFIGDGMNDAPVIASSDVGIAMGISGSDSAIEAADFVIMTDEPSKIAEALRLSKDTRKIVIQNIVFTLAVKAVLLTLGALGIANMWHAVFGDVGAALIAVINSTRILTK